MLSQDPLGTLPLITFRLESRLDELPVGSALQACRIADHRPDYLAYEGPVSGGRGLVQRLTRGTVLSWMRHPATRSEHWELEIQWTVAKQRLEVVRQKLDQWQVFCVTITHSEDKS